MSHFQTPTVLPASYTDPESDAESLKKAMKGLGCDEDAIIKVLTDKNTEQRLQIVHEYEALFKKDLIKELQKELSGNFEDTVVALMTPAYEFLASELKRAVKGAGTDEDTLVLLSILAASKQDPKASPSSVASQLCAVDAKGKIALDSDTLRTVMVSYSRPFLYNVFKEYETITEQPFSNLIKKVSSGDARNALTAIYRGIVSLPTFFAEELQAAFKGLGTKDRKLIRIVVSRAEVDLEDVKQAFSDLYGKSLEKEVQVRNNLKFELRNDVI
ncbi:Annexin B9 [Armadillidium vulgare]|nr:Annexin B9 [Armadillidium vulgare]